MKRYLLASGAVLLAAAAAAVAREQSMLARVTVYWASGDSGSDKWTRNHQAATHVRLRNGHCAVDPRRIPYGSKVVLPDGALVAVDTGKHVKTRRAARLCGRSSAERNAIVVDRFFETKKQALAWANHNPQFITVRVESPNESSPMKSIPSAELLPSRNVIAPQRTLAAVNLPPTPAPTSVLRHSVTTPRDRDAGAISNSATVVSVKQSVVPAATSSPAMRAAPVIKSRSLPATLVASAADDTRSHYGRPVAYLP